MGLLIGFAAAVLVGRQWIYSVAGGVRSLLRFQTTRILKQATKADAQRQKIAAKMAGSPRWWDFFWTEHQLAGLRGLAKQQNHWNKGQRAKWDLPPRSLVDGDGFYDVAQVEANRRELDDYIQHMVETGSPRDMTGLAFKLMLLSLAFEVFGLLPFWS
ncbi:hypothetical protein [Devosia sp.]|uniref:hypothetical protein n=1 Tax=Devosia sp. TaxID=1871048 RepID=UPI002AFEDFC9|nr:hypothetical protein [Devosia sp.]